MRGSSRQLPSWSCSRASCWRCPSGCCRNRSAASRARPAAATFARSSSLRVQEVAMDAPWPFDIRPLTPRLGAEVIGVTLAHGITDQVFAGIYRAFLRHQVLLFEPQDVPPTTHAAFARRFGEVQVHVMNQYHAGGFPELYRLSN